MSRAAAKKFYEVLLDLIDQKISDAASKKSQPWQRDFAMEVMDLLAPTPGDDRW